MVFHQTSHQWHTQRTSAQIEPLKPIQRKLIGIERQLFKSLPLSREINIPYACGTLGGKGGGRGRNGPTLSNRSLAPFPPEPEQETAAWKTFTGIARDSDSINSLVRIIPRTTMGFVRDVVSSFKRESRAIILTKNGALEGRLQQVKGGGSGSFYAFKGIRYDCSSIEN